MFAGYTLIQTVSTPSSTNILLTSISATQLQYLPETSHKTWTHFRGQDHCTASVAALGENSVADLLQVAEISHQGRNNTVPTTTQVIHTKSVTKIGATGLEPATS
jgi:hypothetical protein